MAKTVAVLKMRSAPLSEEFGRTYAERLFGAEALDELPRYTRGRYKGQLKGYVTWLKAERGGWHHQYGVCRPNQLVRAWIGTSYASPEGSALQGTFYGRVQTLAAHGSLLGEENRARETALRAAQDAATMTEAAEMRKNAAEVRAHPLLEGSPHKEIALQIAEALERKADALDPP